MSQATKKIRKSIFDKIRESGLDKMFGIEPPPVRTSSLCPSQTEMNTRVMMVKLYELEKENRRLRGALAEATFLVDAMRKQVAVAKKLLGSKI